MDFDTRERVYSRDEYYWGTEPTSLATRTVDYLPDDGTGLSIVDIGAGEGRDAVFFAERGFEVTAIDISPAGLQKADRLADERGVQLVTIEADANELEFPHPMDVVFSSGVVQFIRPEHRARQFRRFKAQTTPGGIHAMFAFVDHPDIPPAPDTSKDQFLFGRKELQRYYDGWETLHSRERIFDDTSGGIPHKHAARVHIARKQTA